MTFTSLKRQGVHSGGGLRNLSRDTADLYHAHDLHIGQTTTVYMAEPVADFIAVAFYSYLLLLPV